jgi:hypothetical protein
LPLSLEQPVTAKQVALPATTTIEIKFVVRIGNVPFECVILVRSPRQNRSRSTADREGTVAPKRTDFQLIFLPRPNRTSVL